MRTLFLSTVAVILILCVTGCLESYTTVLVKLDGSAQITDSLVLQSFAALSMGTAEDSELEKKLRESFEGKAKKLGKEAKLEKLDYSDYAEKVHVTATYSIPNINDLTLHGTSAIDMLGKGKDKSTKVKKSDALTFKYKNNVLKIYSQGKTTPTPTTRKEPSAEASALDSTQFATIMQSMITYMSGFRVGIYITTERPIISSTATFRNGNRITMYDIDFSKFSEVLKQQPEILESLAKNGSHGSDKYDEAFKNVNTDSLEIEPQKEIQVKF